MDIQLLILNSGETLISYAEELEREPRCHLYRPHLVGGKTKVTLTPWPLYSDDDHILFNSTDLLTVCAPNDKVEKAYLNKVPKPKTQSRPVVLNEDEQIPNEYLDAIDDSYEPRYIEE